MSRRQWWIFAAIGVLATFIAWLALSNRQPPMLPRDDVHATITDTGDCLKCHGADATVPRSRNHPLGNECFRCHGNR